MADQQVLRFTHQCTNTTQRRTHCAVHQQAAQECAELFQVAMMKGRQILVIGVFAVLTRILARRDAVIHRVEPHAGTDDHGGHRQRIEKGRQKRGQETEHQRQQGLGANPEQQARKQEQQQVFHEVDAGHHEHQ
ncbi:hypothetical protein D3C85_1416140 [compost metagenome]